MLGILGKQPHLGCTRPKFGERYPVERIKMLGILVYTLFRYLAYVLVGGACFMAIERPLEKKTCDEIEKQMQSGYAAFKSSTGKSLP